MSETLITGVVVAGNVLVGNIINIGTKIATKKFIQDEKIRSVVNTAVPVVSAIGLGAATSGIITSAWEDAVDDEDIDSIENENEEGEAALVIF